jgi:hypothetical protein
MGKSVKPVLLAMLALIGIVVATNFPPDSAEATPRRIYGCVEPPTLELWYKRDCADGIEFSWSASRPSEWAACMVKKTRQIVMTDGCRRGKSEITWGDYSATKKYLTACVDRRTKKMFVALRGQCGAKMKIRWVKSAPYLPITTTTTTVIDSTTTSTPGPSCASGLGPCEIGDIGPGGGRVFYVDEAEEFPSWDYMEMAPSSWNGASELAGPWCNDTTNGYGAYAPGIGAGESNFDIMVLNCTGIAQTVASYESTYLGQTSSDWFIPSADELSAAYTNLQPLGYWTGFEQTFYWTSSEFQAFPTNAVVLRHDGFEMTITAKEYSIGVVPVRAF